MLQISRSFVLLILLASVVVGCAPTYQPNRLHVPLHGRAEEIVVGGSLGFDRSIGLDVSGAITDNLYIRGGASLSGAMSPGQTFFELAFGAYDTVRKSSLRYGFAGMYGLGKLPVGSVRFTGGAEEDVKSVPYSRMGLQADAGIFSSNAEFFAALRFVMLSHDHFEDGIWTQLIEPGIGVRIGGDPIKFEFQTAVTLPVTRAINVFLWPLQLSVGLSARFR